VTTKPDLVRLGTRGSPLAMWQARWCRDALKAAHEGLEVEIIEIDSAGDVDLKTPLVNMGEVGIFTKTLEAALLGGKIDLAVHSLKDVPAALAEDTEIAAVSEREDPRDVMFIREGKTIDDLPQGALVATGSLRRRAQLRTYREDLKMTALRGNLNTRWRKFEEGDFDAMVLAAAGVIRLGWAERVTAYLPTDVLLPAVAQGIVGVQGVVGSGATELARAMTHAPTHARARAERSLLEAVAGGCVVPLAGFSEIEGGQLHLRARLAHPETGPLLKADVRGPVDDAIAIGQQVGAALLDQGGAKIVAAAKALAAGDA